MAKARARGERAGGPMDTTFKTDAHLEVRPNHDSRERYADQAAADVRLREVLGDAFVAVLLSIGHRTGLLETMAKLPPMSSAAIAKAAGLDERYVREWLAALTSRDVVTYDPTRESYHLPKAMASCLTRDGGLQNLAVLAQLLSVVSEHESRLVDCFRRGDGIPAEQHPHLARVRAEASRLFVESHLLGSVLPLVPRLMARLERGITVADVGCHRGHALEALAESFPASRFIGFDPSADELTIARKRIEHRRLSNAEVFTHDLADPLPGRFDALLSFGALHDLAPALRTFRNAFDALESGGPLLVVDVAGSSRLSGNLANPLATFFYGFSALCALPIARAEGSVGRGPVWGEERTMGLLEEAGFREIEMHHLAADPMHVVFAAWKP